MNLNKASLGLFIACLLVPPVCQGGKHHTTITWNQSAHPDIAGFNVYRGDDPGKENPVPVAKLVASECCKNGTPKCRWEDFDVVPHAKHCYVVKAVLRSGKVLDLPSNETCAITP
jgi:hypothetical protein